MFLPLQRSLLASECLHHSLIKELRVNNTDILSFFIPAPFVVFIDSDILKAKGNDLWSVRQLR